ncbi:MAG: YqaJ viral recombinase family protein [Alphaproteobacteria bacterium]
MSNKDRKEWLKERKLGIGGSEIAAVMGLSKWRGAYDVYLDKISDLAEESPSLAMELGNFLEPLVVKKYEQMTGSKVHPCESIVSSKYEFARCNLDGFVVTQEGDKGILEVKTAGDSRAWGEPGTDEIPEDYFLQCQWNMFVSGTTWCDVPVLFFDRGRHIELYHITYSKQIEELMIDAASKLWQCVESRTPPDPQNADEAERMYGSHQPGKTLEADSELIELVNRIKAVREEIKKLQEVSKVMEGKIKCEMAEAESLTDGGKAIVTWRTANSSRVSISLLKLNHPKIAEEVTTNSTQRRFLLK